MENFRELTLSDAELILDALLPSDHAILKRKTLFANYLYWTLQKIRNRTNFFTNEIKRKRDGIALNYMKDNGDPENTSIVELAMAYASESDLISFMKKYCNKDFGEIKNTISSIINYDILSYLEYPAESNAFQLKETIICVLLRNTILTYLIYQIAMVFYYFEYIIQTNKYYFIDGQIIKLNTDLPNTDNYGDEEERDEDMYTDRHTFLSDNSTYVSKTYQKKLSLIKAESCDLKNVFNQIINTFKMTIIKKISFDIDMRLLWVFVFEHNKGLFGKRWRFENNCNNLSMHEKIFFHDMFVRITNSTDTKPFVQTNWDEKFTSNDSVISADTSLVSQIQPLLETEIHI